MYLIAGLGNPSKTYEGTRHNVGFSMIDALADAFQIDVTTKKHKAIVGRGVIEGMKVILAKPQTYMNLSGESIREIADFYKIDPENMIIIYDDISLDVGRLRIRKKGSDGGHNGIKNIIYLSGSNEFPRIKIGMGQKPEGWDLADWVLSKYSDEELKVLSPAFDNTADALKLIMDGRIEEAMGKYN